MRKRLLAAMLLTAAFAKAQTDTNEVKQTAPGNAGYISPRSINAEVVIVSYPGPYGFPTSFTEFKLSPQLLKTMGRTPVNVVNSIPGVRMEERSPGSYRLYMRGSAIRSPFGTRNTAVYYNGVPITDAGGNTYLNLIDFNQVSGLSVFKGPGPAGFGTQSNGTLLLETNPLTRNTFSFTSSAGSFGFHRHQLDLVQTKGRHQLSVKASYQAAKGYREQSALQRANLLISDRWIINHVHQFSFFVLAAHLDYETPGGLTYDQLRNDPKQARPATAFSPGAEEQQAGVVNNTGIFGITHSLFRGKFHLRSSIFGSGTQFSNPFITNYETRTETNGGARIVANYRFGKLNRDYESSEWAVGAEARINRTDVQNFDNLGGHKGDRQGADMLYAAHVFAFSSVRYVIKPQWTAQASVNVPFTRMYFKHKFPAYEADYRQFSPSPGAFYPAASIQWHREAWKFTGLYSSGYSSPSLQEIRPATQNINQDLRPESTQNLELAVRWTRFRKIGLLANLYTSVVQNAIVRKSDAAGNDYYRNAGSILQNGAELAISYTPWPLKYGPDGFPLTIMLNQSYTYYRFRNYVTDAGIFTGNILTGTPQYTGSLQLMWRPYKHVELGANYQYISATFLDDANSVKAHPAHVLRANASYSFTRSWKWTFFATGDNLLNQRYSLGNDINAYGGRYFNAAPAINFRIGLKIDFIRE